MLQADDSCKFGQGPREERGEQRRGEEERGDIHMQT